MKKINEDRKRACVLILVVTLLIPNLSFRLLAKILLYCRGAGGDTAKSSRACVAVVLTNWQLTLAKRLDAVCVPWYLEGVCGRFYNHPVLPHEPPSKKMILRPATVATATSLRVARKHHRFRQENGSRMTLRNSSKVKQRARLRYARKSDTREEIHEIFS